SCFAQEARARGISQVRLESAQNPPAGVNQAGQCWRVVRSRICDEVCAGAEIIERNGEGFMIGICCMGTGETESNAFSPTLLERRSRKESRHENVPNHHP